MPSSVTQPMRGTDKSSSPAVPPNVRNNPKRTRKGTLKDDKLTVPSSVASSDSNWYAVSSYSHSSLSSSSSISSVEEDSPSKLARRCHNNSLATWRRLRVSGSPSKKNCARIRRSPQRKHLPRRRTRAQPLPQRVSSSIHHAHPFKPEPSVPKQSTAPVFSRSPHSRRLRRLERIPSYPSFSSIPESPIHTSHACQVQRNVNDSQNTEALASAENDHIWLDESDSELSSVPSKSPPSTDSDRNPTHNPTQPPTPGSRTSELHEHEPEKKIPSRSRPILLRRRRSSLMRMCQECGLSVPADSTKAVLADHLICEISPQKSQMPETTSKELPGLDLERLDLVDHEILPEKLEKQEKIGSGAFKDVYKGLYHVSRTRVIKVAICDLRDELTEMDIKELTFLRDLRHENIVRFIGISLPPRPGPVPCAIVSELCENGDLFDYIRNVSPPSDVEIFGILLQISRGLEYLHTRKPMIVHRDCKSTNVLITEHGVAKISDFGLARVRRSARAMIRSLVGTVNWQAVELWSARPQYNEKADVWSAAMTFWETLQWHQPEKRYPFQGMNEHQIYLNVRQKNLRYVQEIDDSICTQLTVTISDHLREAFDDVLGMIL